MTYSAPRQGRFAIILLVSLCLHILFFVLTCEHSAKKHNQNFARQVAEQLQEELKLPLRINDRVSGAMILGRYKNDERLAYLGLYATSGELLVSVGENTPTNMVEDGDKVIIRTPVSEGLGSLGELVVEAKQPTRAIIIGEHWLFLMGVLLIHSIVWLSYGYVARPSKQLIEEITKDVRTKLLMQGFLATMPTNQTTTTSSMPNGNFAKHDKAPETKPTGNEVDELLSRLTKADSQELMATPSALSTQPSVELCVSFEFGNRHEFFSVLADDVKTSYLAVCDEMLHCALKELLALPSAKGVCVTSVERFGEKGACVYLAKTNAQARLINIGALLSRLMLDCHQIVHDKHRALGWFSLPLKSMIYDKKHQVAAKQLSAKHSESIIVILDEENMKILDGVFFVMPLKIKSQPSKLIAYEKACRSIADPNPSMLSILEKLKSRILER